MVVCKLWHVGKEVAKAISDTTGLRNLGYLFDEDEDLPIELGNLERGLGKRGRHRRALINLVMETLPERRVVLCVDPGRGDVIDDLASASDRVRVLTVERTIPDSHLDDHALRTGMIGPTSGSFERRELRRALRHEFGTETAELARTHRNILYQNDLDRPHAENVLDIGHFLRATRPEAERIAARAAELVR